MASHRLKRSMRGALAATAVAAAVGATAGPALADPQVPDTASEAAQRVQDLSHEAEQLTEKKKKAEEGHAAKQAELKRANDEIVRAGKAADQARVAEAKFRKQVNKLTNASYQGARLNELSALLVSETPNEYLDRASALDTLAKDNNDAIEKLSAAVQQAETAEQQARDAKARATRAEVDAARLKDELAKKSDEADAKVDKAEELFNELSAAEQDSLESDGETDYEAPAGAGAAGKAVQVALDQQGDPYIYGAEGPDSFDCSGLIAYAYQEAGVTIGGSTSSQVSDGYSVSTSELKPGDLIFYYSSQSHVSMYVGNGMAVHAPTSNDVVKVAGYSDIGDVTEVRRIVG